MNRDKILEIKRRFKSGMKSAPFNSYKSPESEKEESISLLNESGTGLSDRVEELLRERLLKNNTEATAPIYHAYGMVRDANGLWVRDAPGVVKNRPSQMDTEARVEAYEGDYLQERGKPAYDETEPPVGDIRDIKLRYMRSGRFKP